MAALAHGRSYLCPGTVVFARRVALYRRQEEVASEAQHLTAICSAIWQMLRERAFKLQRLYLACLMVAPRYRGDLAGASGLGSPHSIDLSLENCT